MCVCVCVFYIYIIYIFLKIYIYIFTYVHIHMIQSYTGAIGAQVAPVPISDQKAPSGCSSSIRISSSSWCSCARGDGLGTRSGEFIQRNHLGTKPMDTYGKLYQWIGLRENVQETMVFTIKYRGFLQIFPSSNSMIIGKPNTQLWYLLKTYIH